jgi:hypothetical protein
MLYSYQVRSVPKGGLCTNRSGVPQHFRDIKSGDMSHTYHTYHTSHPSLAIHGICSPFAVIQSRESCRSTFLILVPVFHVKEGAAQNPDRSLLPPQITRVTLGQDTAYTSICICISCRAFNLFCLFLPILCCMTRRVAPMHKSSDASICQALRKLPTPSTSLATTPLLQLCSPEES